ncbi:hypothetical protein AAHA92_25337 [Salvia divinorum]|uniref:Uncharacterized protein n=1 Tax=Salvia divinorum TaxID=28513 RepID=A0ABD1GDI0_SALDI
MLVLPTLVLAKKLHRAVGPRIWAETGLSSRGLLGRRVELAAASFEYLGSGSKGPLSSLFVIDSFLTRILYLDFVK